MGALASGADKIYIDEEKITLEGLQQDVDKLKRAFHKHPQSSSLILNNEHSSKVITTQLMAALYEDQVSNSSIYHNCIIRVKEFLKSDLLIWDIFNKVAHLLA